MNAAKKSEWISQLTPVEIVECDTKHGLLDTMDGYTAKLGDTLYWIKWWSLIYECTVFVTDRGTELISSKGWDTWPYGAPRNIEHACYRKENAEIIVAELSRHALLQESN